jgi:Lon protease-like protein
MDSACTPPERSSQPESTCNAPLFPLANVWLFPGVIMPLHIFEPRYRQMIEDSLDGPGRIVIGTVVEGHEYQLPGSPPVHPIAGIGEIGWHERLEDGRFLIHLVGLARVRVRECESARMYRRVRVELLNEPPTPTPCPQPLRAQVIEAIQARTLGTPPASAAGRKPAASSQKRLELPPEMPLGRLADLLALRVAVPHRVRQDLFAELDPLARARRALEEHARHPPSAPGSSEASSQSNAN